jgi:hypothetical protein
LYGWLAGELTVSTHEKLREEALYIVHTVQMEESGFLTMESFLMRGEEGFMVGLVAKIWY